MTNAAPSQTCSLPARENRAFPFGTIFDRMIQDFGAPPAMSTAAFAPDLDVTEREDAFLVKADIPGVEAKDIQVNFEREVLTISGEKKSAWDEKDERCHCRGRSYGRFERQIAFRTPVEGDAIEATFKNGVLTLRLPKQQKARGRTITVKE